MLALVAEPAQTCDPVAVVDQGALIGGQGVGIAVRRVASVAIGKVVAMVGLIAARAPTEAHGLTVVRAMIVGPVVTAALARIAVRGLVAEKMVLGLEALARIGARKDPGPATALAVQIEGLRARKVRVEMITVEGKILQPLGVVHAGVDHKPRHHPARNFR